MPTLKSLSEAVEDYMRYRVAKGRAASTVTNEGFVLRRFVAWYGDVQMRNMTAEKVADWFYGDQGLRAEHVTRDRRCRAPVKESTHNYYRTRLNSFFRFATTRGWIRIDLLDEVDILREPTVLRQRPDPALLNEMIANTSCDRDRALITTLVHTALRKNEVLAIQVKDVDLSRGSLFAFISKSQLEDEMPVTAGLARVLGTVAIATDATPRQTSSAGLRCWPGAVDGHGQDQFSGVDGKARENR